MILCCGEALIDMLPRTTAEGEASFAPHAGGAVFNTAVALGRLAVPVGFFCGLSSDLFGDQLAAVLAGSGVSTALCPRPDRPTTLAFVTLTNGHAKYAFYDENTAMRMLEPQDLPIIGPDVSALFFGGISLVSEPCGTAFEALARREAPSRVVMLDPNIRPGFIRDQGSYRARLGRLTALADIVKLSDEDLRWLVPDQPEAEAVQTLLSQGPALVLVTKGAEGATAYGGFGRVHVKARRITVVDTVGAGDTFNAGVLAGLHRSGHLTKPALRDLPDGAIRVALEHAVRVAAVTASRAGANPPWLSEVPD